MSAVKFIKTLIYGTVIVGGLVFLYNIGQMTRSEPIYYTVSQDSYTVEHLVIKKCWINGCRFTDMNGKYHVFNGKFRQIQE